jgi:hypothetical protein
MARVHCKDLSTVNIDNSGGTPADFKADTLALNFEVSVDEHDTTTIGDSWHEVTAGLKGGDEITIEHFYNNTNSTGIWAVMTGRLGVEGTLSFTDGTRTVSMETNVSKLSLPIQVGDMMKFTATHKITGAVTFS